MTFTEIKNRTYFLTGTTSSSFSDANLTLAIGRAMERVISLINRYYTGWSWDDSNYSDLNTATLTITSGQQQYSLATSHLSIDRIELKDSSGDWRRLKQIDQQEFKRDKDEALAFGETTPSTGRTGAYRADTGVPEEYDLIGINLYLLPVPNFTLAAAMRIYFIRGPLLFDYSTGKFTDGTGAVTSSPGFNSLYHDLVPLWASYDYCFAKGKQNANQIFIEIQRKEQTLIDDYENRNRDKRARFNMSSDSNE